MSKKILILSSAISLVVITTFSLLSFKFFGQTNVAYIQNDQLFKEFKAKKELETDLLKLKNQQDAFLDSLRIELVTLNNKIKTSSGSEEWELLKSKEENYTRLLSEFESVKERKEKEYLGQIWNQINQYVQDYGAMKGYDFIYGATGDGGIMYADKSKNITQEVISYINSRYAGNE